MTLCIAFLLFKFSSQFFPVVFFSMLPLKSIWNRHSSICSLHISEHIPFACFADILGCSYLRGFCLVSRSNYSLWGSFINGLHFRIAEKLCFSAGLLCYNGISFFGLFHCLKKNIDLSVGVD